MTHPIPGARPPLIYLSALPTTTPIARLIVLHGYGDHAGRHYHFMQWMADRGFACYAVDFRGHGRSAGKPVAILRWNEYLDDLKHFLAIDELAGNDTPLFIVAHSHGGLITIAAAMAGMLNHIRGIVLVAPYLELKMPVPIAKRLAAGVASRLLPTLAIKSGLNGPMLTHDSKMINQGKDDPYCRGIATPRWFFETVKMQRQIRSNPQQFKHPLLMLIPGEDAVANGQTSTAFFNACASTDKTNKHYPDQRHELLREINRQEVFQEILGWIQARLPSPPFSPR